MLDSIDGRKDSHPGRQPLATVLTDDFLDRAANELTTCGFVTDEHEFAPYRETMNDYAVQIEQALRARGSNVTLGTGKVTGHPDAGYSYYIYDKAKFPNEAAAGEAAYRWLSELYADNKDA